MDECAIGDRLIQVDLKIPGSCSNDGESGGHSSQNTYHLDRHADGASQALLEVV